MLWLNLWPNTVFLEHDLNQRIKAFNPNKHYDPQRKKAFKVREIQFIGDFPIKSQLAYDFILIGQEFPFLIDQFMIS